MTIRRLLAAAAMLLALAGCSSDNPAKPVDQVPLSALSVVPSSDTVQVGMSVAFTVVALDTAGAPVANPYVSWSSGNTAVFRVSSAGFVSGVAEGSDTLYAASGGLVARAVVVVVPAARGWSRQQSNTTNPLNGIWFDAGGNSGYAVGDGGTVMHTTNAGASWTRQTIATTFNLNAVWFTSATEGWIVGGAGQIFHTLDGVHWTIAAYNPGSNLNDVTFATPDTGWAVGATGTILRTFDGGATWARTNVSGVTLNSVSFAGTRDGWVTGQDGSIYGTHDRGLTWFRVLPPVTAQSLNDVWRVSAATAIAVGSGVSARTVVTPDSVAWQLVTQGANNDLRAVHFVDDQHGWAVGVNGTALVIATANGGTTWSTQTANEGNALEDVWFVDERRGWAVGKNGTILHTSTGGQP